VVWYTVRRKSEREEEPVMLEESFSEVYTKFKLHFYQEIFSRFQTREASLTAVETFCMEIILALKEPTINEFASFVHISSPNAAYKVNSLIQKGYVEKVQSSQDRREYHLRPTQKYMNYYNISSHYLQEVMNRVKARFTPEEAKQLDEMLQVVGEELMPEVQLKRGE
jgi:DNA-binding MarR family transcriptional regulator